MSERDIHTTFPESRKKLERLMNVPVEKDHAQRLTDLLEAHGARLTLTHRKRSPSEGPARTVHFYTIDFPTGTYREYGMSLSRSAPFTIYFPDGFEQPGADLYKIDCALDDPPMICLYLLKQE